MPGAPPPGQIPGGVGAASAPGPMAGSAQQGMTAVRLAVEALQKALPALPMGTPLHGAVVKAVGDITKHMEGSVNSSPDQAAQIQQLMALARQAQMQPQQNAMMNAFPAGGAGGAGGGPPPGPGAG
jgi:hypothetical protein